LNYTWSRYDDHYFIEVDRDTENPARVLAACVFRLVRQPLVAQVVIQLNAVGLRQLGDGDSGVRMVHVGLLARWFRAIRTAGRPRKKRRVRAARVHFPAAPEPGCFPRAGKEQAAQPPQVPKSRPSITN